MSNLMALAQGLRAAGGVLSPDVYKSNQEEEMQRERQRQAQQQFMAQRVISAVESGAMPKEQGMMALQRLGLGMPDGALGPTPEAQARMDDLDTRRMIREIAPEFSPGGKLNAPALVAAVSAKDPIRGASIAKALGIDMQPKPLVVSPDQVVRDGNDPTKVLAAGVPKSPEKSELQRLQEAADAMPDGPRREELQGRINILTGRQDRPDGTQQERALATLRELAIKKKSNIALTDDDWLKADGARALLSQSRMQIDPVTQQPMFSQPITIPPSLDLWAGQPKQPPTTPTETPRAGPTNDVSRGPGRRPIDADTEKVLRGLGEAHKQLEGLADTFNPKFSGFVLDSAAEAAIQAGRRLPESLLRKIPGMSQQDLSGTAEWWQRYNNWANDVRAGKFGLTLTANELEAFKAAMPKPSDRPEILEKNIAFQTDLLREKIVQNLNSVSQGGYSTAQAEALALPPGPPRRRRTEEPRQEPVRQADPPRQGPSASGEVVRRIRSQADFDALPSGSTFVGPDGIQRRKP